MEEGRAPLGRWLAHVVITTVTLALAARLVDRVVRTLHPAAYRPGLVLALGALVALVLVVLVARFRARAAADDGLPFVTVVLTGAVLGYLAQPQAWRGSALFGWQVTDPGPSTFTVDLMAWVAAAAVGVLWGTSTADHRPRVRSGYR